MWIGCLSTSIFKSGSKPVWRNFRGSGFEGFSRKGTTIVFCWGSMVTVS